MFLNRKFYFALMVALVAIPNVRAELVENRVKQVEIEKRKIEQDEIAKHQSGENKKADSRTGVIDAKRAFESVPQYGAAKKKLEDQFAIPREKLNKMVKEIETWTQQLEKEASIMPEKNKIELQRKIESHKRTLDFESKVLQEDIRRRELEEMNKIDALVKKATENIRIARKFDLVVEKRTTFSFDPKVEITDDVIREVSQMS